jgi:phage gpG-like protein
MKFNIRVHDVAQKREFDRLLNRLSHPQKALKRIGKAHVDYYESLFRTQNDPDGHQWKALAPATVEFKKREGYPSTIGTMTGELKDSLSFTVSKNTITISTSAEHGRWFNFGHGGGWGYTPPRPFLGTNRQLDDYALKILQRHIED